MQHCFLATHAFRSRICKMKVNLKIFHYLASSKRIKHACKRSVSVDKLYNMKSVAIQIQSAINKELLKYIFVCTHLLTHDQDQGRSKAFSKLFAKILSVCYSFKAKFN